MRRLLRYLPALLLAPASAAGWLATSASPTQIQQSAFCQQQRCAAPDAYGRTWDYDLRATGSHVLRVQRESSDPASRVTSVSLLSANGAVNGEIDRRLFGDMQRASLGFVSNAGRPEPCYALDGSTYRVLSTAPDDRTAQLYCDWDEAYTRFVIEADRAYLTRTAPAPVTISSGPTKLNTWAFTTCVGAGGTNSYLTMGEAARCTLRVTTKGEQSAIVKAELQYEIEYVQNGQYVKKLLPEKELWLPGRTPGPLDPRLTQQGRAIDLNVSLAVKKVPGRRVTSVNTIARLTFANGAVKTAYEPLLVR